MSLQFVTLAVVGGAAMSLWMWSVRAVCTRLSAHLAPCRSAGRR